MVRVNTGMFMAKPNFRPLTSVAPLNFSKKTSEADLTGDFYIYIFYNKRGKR
jgi:hypothetical protein